MPSKEKTAKAQVTKRLWAAIEELWLSDSFPQRGLFFSACHLHKVLSAAGVEIDLNTVQTILKSCKIIDKNRYNQITYFRPMKYQSTHVCIVSENSLDAVGPNNFDKIILDNLKKVLSEYLLLLEPNSKKEDSGSANTSDSPSNNNRPIVQPVTPPPISSAFAPTVLSTTSSTLPKTSTNADAATAKTKLTTTVICLGIKSARLYQCYEIEKGVILDRFCVFPPDIIRHQQCSYNIEYKEDLHKGGVCTKCYNRNKKITRTREQKIFLTIEEPKSTLVSDYSTIKSCIQTEYYKQPEDEFLNSEDTKWLVSKLEIDYSVDEYDFVPLQSPDGATEKRLYVCSAKADPCLLSWILHQQK